MQVLMQPLLRETMEIYYKDDMYCNEHQQREQREKILRRHCVCVIFSKNFTEDFEQKQQ